MTGSAVIPKRDRVYQQAIHKLYPENCGLSTSESQACSSMIEGCL